MAECFHIAAFAFAVGSVVLVDLRMLGVSMRRGTAAQLLKDTWAWTLIGLVIVLLSGMALFLSDPRLYYYNQSFRFKVTALTLAVLFNYTIHRKVANSDASPMVSKLVALLSLALWLSVVFAGIFIAFV